jgi:hypothetical protein
MVPTFASPGTTILEGFQNLEVRHPDVKQPWTN